MPASSAYAVDSASVGEMSRQNSIEDQRAMQLALELSLLNIGNGNELHQQYGSHHQHGSGSLSPASTAQLYHQHTMDQIASLHYADEIRYLTKKSQNMTECVPVPSSEHVAEIVGRQGCKIKALRAKTNTYIKTPVRGEEPVFVVTGRKEDVCSAKREILSAAEHFSQIRASRRSGLIGQCGLVGATGLVPPPPVPGQITIQVRVPYRVVGLVVGPKGATIKRIQQQSSTYIVTPSREKEPIFEVTGMPDNVEQAKREIEGHIAIRTGLVNVDGSGNDLSSDMMMHDLAAGLNGLGFSGMLGGMDTANGLGSNDLMGSLYKNPSALRSAFGGHNDYSSASLSGNTSSGLSQLLGDHTFGGLRSSNNGSNPFNSATHGSKMESSELQTLGSGLLNSLYDSDEGIGLGGSDSPTLSHSLIQPNIWSTDFGLAGSSSSTAATNAAGAKRSNSFGFSTQDSEHPPARRISSDPLTAIGTTLSSLSAAFQIRSDSDSGVRGDSSASGSASPAASPAASSSSSSSSTRGSLKRECIMCCEGEMVAALVPCGHKLFCMDCAQSLVTKTETAAAAAVAASNTESTEDSSEQEENPKSGHDGGECPVCHQSVTQAIRIFS